MDNNSPGPFRSSGSQTRMSSANVAQLDKINAIPNKTNHDSVLMSDLSPDDRHYISALIDDSSSSEEDDRSPHIGSTWSPMLQSPELTRKTRMKRLSTAYKVSLSLEDISYIRPSWGLSKGLRNLEMSKQRAAAATKRQRLADKGGPPTGSEPPGPKAESEKELRARPEGGRLVSRVDPMYYFMALLVVVVLVMLVPPYLARRHELDASRRLNRLELEVASRLLRVFRPDTSSLRPSLEVQFGRSIVRNLRPDTCSCDKFQAELLRHAPKEEGAYLNSSENNSTTSTCLACLDWAFRSNFRLNVDRQAGGVDETSPPGHCYLVRWQSYDSLATPLEDCFRLTEGQWLGLGDLLEAPDWPPASNLSAGTGWRLDLSADHTTEQQQHLLGAHVELALLSTSGVFVGNLRSDFHVSLLFASPGEFCLQAECGDRCGREWARPHASDRPLSRNNFLEYQICTAADMRTLMARQVAARVAANSPRQVSAGQDARPPQLPEPIGLIERPLFSTNRETMGQLDGQSLRKFVEQIVRLHLNTGPILLVDDRWQTEPGSMALNKTAFPHVEQFFEILHNRGFKVVLSLKAHKSPGRLSPSEIFTKLLYMVPGTQPWLASPESAPNSTSAPAKARQQPFQVLRRRSFFGFERESVQAAPESLQYLFACRETPGGNCFLWDLTRENNRKWLLERALYNSNLLKDRLVDGIRLDCEQPNSFWWDRHFRRAVAQVEETFFYQERQFVVPKRSGALGFMQLATRTCSWEGLRSVASSVLNVGALGFALVHPGPVWGRPGECGGGGLSLEAEMELRTRWLQVAVFWPVVQFADLGPIERFQLRQQLEDLMRLRKSHLVPELKRNLPYTPLVGPAPLEMLANRLPLVRPVWVASPDGAELIAPEQFTIGNDLLVAPILHEGLRQRDIYLPSGDWRDQLRQTNLRGGKWLRNYRVELTQVAWFSRWKRR